MRSVVVLAGSIQDDDVCRNWLVSADDIICADGGARFLRRVKQNPDLLIGDMDSIDAADLVWIENELIPIDRHAVRKNETDAELAIHTAIRRQSESNTPHHEIIVLGALGNRADHVLATQLLAASLATVNRTFLLTDGVTSVWTLVGGQILTIDAPVSTQDWMVSVAAVSGTLEGLTYEGLQYPLINATLNRGASRGISNRLSPDAKTAQLTCEKGEALVFLAPDR